MKPNHIVDLGREQLARICIANDKNTVYKTLHIINIFKYSFERPSCHPRCPTVVTFDKPLHSRAHTP